jgi:catechol 2,3-dioxygenase-like lactoylglutathione lyase family enzyme
MDEKPVIRGLHHNAYRCRDAEETRKFYEDFLGLELADAFEIGTTKTGRGTRVLHMFFQMDDGSFLAFFEAPGHSFQFKDQHDFDLHIALEVDMETLHRMFAKGQEMGIETRGISDHGFIHSIYFRDPNGYVIELTAKTDARDEDDWKRIKQEAREVLANWTATKPADAA